MTLLREAQIDGFSGNKSTSRRVFQFIKRANGAFYVSACGVKKMQPMPTSARSLRAPCDNKIKPSNLL